MFNDFGYDFFFLLLNYLKKKKRFIGTDNAGCRIDGLYYIIFGKSILLFEYYLVSILCISNNL